jgi:hypothetical protein
MPDISVGLDGFQSRAPMGLNGKALSIGFDDCPTCAAPRSLTLTWHERDESSLIPPPHQRSSC